MMVMMPSKMKTQRLLALVPGQFFGVGVGLPSLKTIPAVHVCNHGGLQVARHHGADVCTASEDRRALAEFGLLVPAAQAVLDAYKAAAFKEAH